jgi:hypothetical protein
MVSRQDAYVKNEFHCLVCGVKALIEQVNYLNGMLPVLVLEDLQPEQEPETA